MDFILNEEKTQETFRVTRDDSEVAKDISFNKMMPEPDDVPTDPDNQVYKETPPGCLTQQEPPMLWEDIENGHLTPPVKSR